MKTARLVSLTLAALVALAANSLLCRLALRDGHIDPAGFTVLRLASAAITLWLILAWRGNAAARRGDWPSAVALFVYAAAFSYAYVSLPAAAGALLLFGAVQATMIGVGLWRGARLTAMQCGGLALAGAGVVALMSPGLSAPPAGGSALMIAAGVAWGVYTLRGLGAAEPVAVTAGNFLRAMPFAAVLAVVLLPGMKLDGAGAGYAVASGAVTSGLGYALWYGVLPRLGVTKAAALQLSIPMIATVGATIVLDEAVNLRLVGSSLAILGGIALVILANGKPAAAAGTPSRG